MLIKSINELQDLIATDACPDTLRLTLYSHKFNHDQAQQLEKTLTGSKCPAGLILVLRRNLFSIHGRPITHMLPTLVNILQSVNCPDELTISLRSKLTDAGAKALATAIMNPRAPDNLTIELIYTQLTDAGAQALATAIMNPRAPDNLTIELNQALMNKPYWQSALRIYQKNRLIREYASILSYFASGLTSSGAACHLNKISGIDPALQCLIEFLDPTADQSDSHILTQELKYKMENLTRNKKNKRTAATIIQRHCRGTLTRNEIKKTAATIIQRRCRGTLSGNEIKKSTAAAHIQRSLSIFCQSRPGMPQDLTPIDPAHNPYAIIIHSGKLKPSITLVQSLTAIAPCCRGTLTRKKISIEPDPAGCCSMM